MKTLIFPEAVNPYQELLYRPMREAHPSDAFTYLPASPRNLALFPFVVAMLRLRGYRIFHLHWHTLYLDKKYHIPGSKLISLIYSLICLSFLKLFGYKVIWTVHNVLPHEQQTTNDTLVARFTARISSKLIVHSAIAKKQLEDIGIDTAKTTVISHGNYDGVYLDVISPTEARRNLSVHVNETVILFFGLIRPYKGIEDLLKAFTTQKMKDTRLMIVGRCADDSLKATILKAAEGDVIDFYPGYVKDEDVATYFRAADVVCLPFKSVTTSGSALLALTFGKPLIAPRSGALVDLPETVGYLYDPQAPNALTNALHTAVANKSELKQLSESALNYSKTLSWNAIAKTTYSVYKDALGITEPDE